MSVTPVGEGGRADRPDLPAAEVGITPAPGPEEGDTFLPPPPPPTFGPVGQAERIASIDFVRGMALLGILLVNALVMFGPLAMLQGPSLVAGMPVYDQVAYLLIVSLCLGKFISTFSMLFGYGLTGQIEKAASAGRSPVGFAARRLGALAVFGLVHALMLWYGDILFIYAMLGGFLLLTRWISTRLLGIVAIVLLACSVVLHAVPAGLASLAPSPREQTHSLPVPEGTSPPLAAMLRAGPNPASPVWVEAETEAYRDGPWSAAMTFRAVSWLFALVGSVLFFGVQVLAMFAIGAWMWRVRLFDPGQAGLRWRLFRVCLPVGLALEALAASFFWSGGLTDHRLWAVGGVIQGVAICFLPLGYVCGLALLTERLPAWVRAPVTSAGRMALTVYLMETVVATGLSYHWGLQLFGRLGVLAHTGLAVAIWAGLVLASWLWLQVFRQGPMERLWRRLEYGR